MTNSLASRYTSSESPSSICYIHILYLSGIVRLAFCTSISGFRPTPYQRALECVCVCVRVCRFLFARRSLGPCCCTLLCRVPGLATLIRHYGAAALSKSNSSPLGRRGGRCRVREEEYGVRKTGTSRESTSDAFVFEFSRYGINFRPSEHEIYNRALRVHSLERHVCAAAAATLLRWLIFSLRIMREAVFRVCRPRELLSACCREGVVGDAQKDCLRALISTLLFHDDDDTVVERGQVGALSGIGLKFQSARLSGGARKGCMNFQPKN